MKRFGCLSAPIFWLASAGSGLAGEPAGTLPEGMFATGEGCAALAKALPEDIAVMDFMVMSNTELMGQEFECSFRDATVAGAAEAGKLWSVKAECGSGGMAKSSMILIKQVAADQLHVTMTLAGGEPDVLGTFSYCPNVLTD